MLLILQEHGRRHLFECLKVSRETVVCVETNAEQRLGKEELKSEQDQELFQQ